MKEARASLFTTRINPSVNSRVTMGANHHFLRTRGKMPRMFPVKGNVWTFPSSLPDRLKFVPGLPRALPIFFRGPSFRLEKMKVARAIR